MSNNIIFPTTPPYSEAMKGVCAMLEERIDTIIEHEVSSGKTKEEAQQIATNTLTQGIKLPE